MRQLQDGNPRKMARPGTSRPSLRHLTSRKGARLTIAPPYLWASSGSYDPPRKPPYHLLRGAWVNKLVCAWRVGFFGDGKFLAPLVNAERGGRWLKCEGTSCLPDIYASHLFLAPRDEWTDSGAVCPYPCPPSRVRGVRGAFDERRGGGPELGTRPGACQCLCPTLPALCFPFWGSGIAVGGTHSLCGLPLVSGVRRAAQDWPAVLHAAYYCARCTASASLAPWFIVRTEMIMPLSTGRPVSERDTTGMYFNCLRSLFATPCPC